MHHVKTITISLQTENAASRSGPHFQIAPLIQSTNNDTLIRFRQRHFLVTEKRSHLLLDKCVKKKILTYVPNICNTRAKWRHGRVARIIRPVSQIEITLRRSPAPFETMVSRVVAGR